MVSIVFIQRHFEGVTEQMSRAVISELSLLSKQLIADQGLTETTENLANALNITIETVVADAPDLATFRHFYDLTGLVVVKEFELMLDTGEGFVKNPTGSTFILSEITCWICFFTDSMFSPGSILKFIVASAVVGMTLFFIPPLMIVGAVVV